MPENDHRWSGWPGAWCLDCGLEDANELDLAGLPEEVHHRYSKLPHTAQPCAGCSNGPCAEPGSRRHDPYHRRESVREIAEQAGIDLSHRDPDPAQTQIDWLTRKPMVEDEE